MKLLKHWKGLSGFDGGYKIVPNKRFNLPRHQFSFAYPYEIRCAMSKLRRLLCKWGSKGEDDSLNRHKKGQQLAANLNGSGKIKKNASASSEDLRSFSVNGNDDSHNGQQRSKKQLRKLARRKSHETRIKANQERRQEILQQKREKGEEAAREEPGEIQRRYGDLPLMQSREQDSTDDERWHMDSFSAQHAGEEITLRARVHAVRKMSAKLAFVVLRQQLATIQGVLQEKEGEISTHMVQWAESIPTESIVLAKGRLQRPKVPVKGCSIHDLEISIQELHVVARKQEPTPFTPYEAEVSKEMENKEEGNTERISDRVRLSNRIVDLRTTTSQAVFRINSGICNLFRSYLDLKGFVEIHTPKLQSGATESGASVFQLDYFGRPAFLAQSPQLAKQMCIASDFERVYEIGPVFRAENSNTHRHLTEYTGLDLEMAIEEHYHEALYLIDATLKHIFQGLYDRFGREVEHIKRHFPHDDLLWLKETPRIPFVEGIRMLRDSGWTDEDGSPPSEHEDLHTRDEIRLGELVKEKYKTDYYILDKFPASARPFYTMPDHQDDKVTNSFDIFLRGQEILTGGQRIHDPKLLEEKMLAQGVDPASMDEYMEGFRLGAPPHAGAGIGLERLVMLILELGNIRLASLYPRDPKSLPAKPPGPNLRHPKDSTVDPPWGHAKAAESKHQLQSLENLIANYGDATNTSWTDDRYKIWRHMETGAAIAYVPIDGYAILPGNPLCDPSQYTLIVSAFLNWLKNVTHMKPIWVLVGCEMEEVLVTKFGWKTFTCAAEERVNPDKNVMDSNHDVGRKVRHAEREGLKIIELPEHEPVPQEIQEKCNARIKDWQAGRKGKQVHLSEITPWRDMSHRRYFYAQDKQGTIHALVVLAQLAPRYGYQVKWALEFPGATSGAIEAITLHAIRSAKASGTKQLTFGSAATSELHAVHNLGGIRVRMLQHTYQSITKQFKLSNKGDFRQKLGAEEESIYICYPPYGLGIKGSKAIVDFFESEH